MKLSKKQPPQANSHYLQQMLLYGLGGVATIATIAVVGYNLLTKNLSDLSNVVENQPIAQLISPLEEATATQAATATRRPAQTASGTPSSGSPTPGAGGAFGGTCDPPYDIGDGNNNVRCYGIGPITGQSGASSYIAKDYNKDGIMDYQFTIKHSSGKKTIVTITLPDGSTQDLEFTTVGGGAGGKDTTGGGDGGTGGGDDGPGGGGSNCNPGIDC
jgi:hypothetical protein